MAGNLPGRRRDHGPWHRASLMVLPESRGGCCSTLHRHNAARACDPDGPCQGSGWPSTINWWHHRRTCKPTPSPMRIHQGRRPAKRPKAKGVEHNSCACGTHRRLRQAKDGGGASISSAACPTSHPTSPPPARPAHANRVDSPRRLCARCGPCNLVGGAADLAADGVHPALVHVFTARHASALHLGGSSLGSRRPRCSRTICRTR